MTKKGYVRGCDVFIMLWRHHSDFMRKPWRCSCFSKMDRYLLAFTQRRNHGDNRLDWQRMPTYPSDEYCEHDSCLQALRLFALLMPELTLLRRWQRATEVLSLACFQFLFFGDRCDEISLTVVLIWLIDVLSKQRSFLTRLGSPFPRKLLDIWWESL